MMYFRRQASGTGHRQYQKVQGTGSEVWGRMTRPEKSLQVYTSKLTLFL